MEQLQFVIISLLLTGLCGRLIVHRNNSLHSTEALGNISEAQTTTSFERLSKPFRTNSSSSTDENIHEDIATNSSQNSSEVLHEDLSSNINDTECNCSWRYFKHYEVKGCYVEEFDSCWCPKKFLCPKNETLQVPAKVCVYQNKEYQVGSKILTSNACQVCRCRHGDPPFIACSSKECPVLDPAPGKNCHLVYKENSCCPKGYECVDGENENETENIETCEYNGILYPFGSKIYPLNNPCQVCVCNENWNGTNNSSCYLQDCVLDKNKPQLEAGCIPVYHENRCCPIEFYCPSSHDFSYTLLSMNKTENSEMLDGDKCSFGGQLFDLGSEIHMDNPCVTCICSVTPDFSCIHRSCPPSPSTDNCYPIYSPKECCPSYECLLGDSESESEACPTPLCADSSCHIGILPGHECPTCICGERVSELEHNNLQQDQQSQQISQNFEPFHEMYEEPRVMQVNADDYSEDELQLMPIQMQDEGQVSVMEKIILSEFEHNPEEELRELDDISIEGNSNTETELSEDTEKNADPLLDNSAAESSVGKEIKKRSEITDAPYHKYEVDMPFQQESLEGDLEREGEDSENHGDFEDELESLKNKLFANNTIINEIISINHEVPVPEGCPTPMCEGPWCKVGIPEGHRCPTCICKRNIDKEP